MPRRNKFQMSESQIIDFFEASGEVIFPVEEIRGIFEQMRDKWKLAQNMSSEKFIEQLLNIQPPKFSTIPLIFPRRKSTWVAYGDINFYLLASNITSRAYLSHYSCLSIHNLTEQSPKTIYVTHEQSPKLQQEIHISQDSIRDVFMKEQRMTNNFTELVGYKIVIHEGKNSNNLGVVSLPIEYSKRSIRFTDLERTLIDITVRPDYAGGVNEVLKAYQNAHKKVSLNRLNALLNKLNYIYPYHQAIGFYLDKAGLYKPSLLEIFRKKQMIYDFFLTYNMKDLEYSEKWKIFYPKGL